MKYKNKRVSSGIWDPAVQIETPKTLTWRLLKITAINEQTLGTIEWEKSET